MSNTVSVEDYDAALSAQEAAAYRASRAEAETNRWIGEVQRLDHELAASRAQAEALAEALELLLDPPLLGDGETISEREAERDRAKAVIVLADYRKAKGA